jgi:hypothetical protein
MPGNQNELTLKERVQVLKLFETHSERKAKKLSELARLV